MSDLLILGFVALLAVALAILVRVCDAVRTK